MRRDVMERSRTEFEHLGISALNMAYATTRCEWYTHMPFVGYVSVGGSANDAPAFSFTFPRFLLISFSFSFDEGSYTYEGIPKRKHSSSIANQSRAAIRLSRLPLLAFNNLKRTATTAVRHIWSLHRTEVIYVLSCAVIKTFIK